MPGILSGYAGAAAAGHHRRAEGRPARLGPAAHPAVRHLRLRPRRAVRARPASTSPRSCRCRSCPATRWSPSCSRTARTCPAGTRVVLDPVLTCAARGVEPCESCAAGAHQPVLADHRRPPGARPADRLLQGHRRRLGPAADRAPQPAARGARGLLRRAGAADRAARVRGAHRAAGRRARRTTGCSSAAPARSACSPRSRCASSPPAGEIIVVAKHGHQRELALRVRRHRGGRARRGAAPGTPLDRRLPAQAGVLRAVPPRRRRRRRRRGRQQAVAGDRAAAPPAPAAGWCCPGCPPPPTCRAAWFRELEVVGTYASSQPESTAAAPSTSRPSWSSPTPSSGSPSPWPATRCTAGARRSTTPTSAGRLGTVKVAFDPRSSYSESPRIRARGRRPDPAAGRPRGARASGWRTSRSAPAWSTRRSRCPPCRDVDEAIRDALLQPARLRAAAGAAARRDAADHRLRRPVDPAADDEGAGHPAAGSSSTS